MNHIVAICPRCNIRPVKKQGKFPTGEQRYGKTCAVCCHALYGRGKKDAGRHHCRKDATPKSLVCEICGEEKPLVLDHCHTTIKFRGWLCTQCNCGLGFFRDNTTIMQKAIKYLQTTMVMN